MYIHVSWYNPRIDFFTARTVSSLQHQTFAIFIQETAGVETKIGKLQLKEY